MTTKSTTIDVDDFILGDESFIETPLETLNDDQGGETDLSTKIPQNVNDVDLESNDSIKVKDIMDVNNDIEEALDKPKDTVVDKPKDEFTKDDVDNVDNVDNVDDVDDDIMKPSKDENLEEDDFSFVPLAEEISEAIGLKFQEDWIPEEDRKSVKGVVNFLKEVIEKNSAPEFADPEVEKINSYVAKGGDLKKYLETHVTKVNYETLDLTKERDQELAVKEFYKTTTNWTDDKVDRYVERIKEDGELEEESKSSKDYLVTEKEKEKENLSKTLEQEEADRRQAAQLKREDNINKIKTAVKKADKESFGFTLNDKSTTEFSNFLTEPDPKTGLTKYQTALKDIPNLELRLAFLVYNGIVSEDDLGKEINTKSVDNLETMLRKYSGSTRKGSGAGSGKPRRSSNKSVSADAFVM